MPKKADIGSKRLIGLSPDAWAQWILQRSDITTQDILSAEFQWISRESDVLIQATSPQDGQFLILNELQLRYTPSMPRRMRAYAALAEERYKLSVYPVLINFLPPSRNTIIVQSYESTFMGLRALQDYHVINLWEVDAQIAFQPELLSLIPFVPIMQGGNTTEMVQQAAYQLRQNPNLSEFEPLLGFFANFVLDSALVQQILRWDMVILEESPWYQEILGRGLQRGRQEGRQEEAANLVIRLLTRRLTGLEVAVEAQIHGLGIAQLETLSEALLDFTKPDDLTNWLRQQA